MAKSCETIAFEAALQLTISANKGGNASHVLEHFTVLYEGLKEIATKDNIQSD